MIERRVRNPSETNNRTVVDIAERAALDFLDQLRPGGPWVLTAIHPDTGRITTITASDKSTARAFIHRYDGRRNLYFSVNPTRRDMDCKPAKTDTRAIEYLLADLDPKQGEASNDAKQRYRDQLQRFEPTPTAIIDSGNGIQCLWRLKQPIRLRPPRRNAEGKLEFSPEDVASIADAEERAKALMQRLGAKAGTQNIDRIPRLPGTLNLPNEKKRREGRTKCRARLLAFNNRTHDLHDFPTPLPDQPRSTSSNERETVVRRNRDESGSGHGYRFMRERKAAGDTFEQACTAILANQGPEGEWARRSDDRQLRRAWDNAKVSNTNEQTATLEVVRLSDVEMKPVRWVWPRRLARGKVTIFSGLPFLGKSLISIDATARVTRGLEWPDGGRAQIGNVVLLSAEDAIDDTTKPRVVAAGGDPDRVTVVKMVKEPNEARRLFKLQTDLELLESKIAEIGDVELVIIDPVSSYMGEKEGNSITAFRPVLAQLMEFAERTDVAVLIIHHPPKTADKAINAFSGSLAFIAAPRFGFIVVKEDENERRLLLSVGSNIGLPADGLGFYVVEHSVPLTRDTGRGVRRVGTIETGKIEWDRMPVTVTASEALRASEGSRHNKLDEAVEFLDEALAGGERDVNELLDAARARGIAERTLKRAKEKLRVDAHKTGFEDRWVWQRRVPRRRRTREPGEEG